MFSFSKESIYQLFLYGITLKIYTPFQLLGESKYKIIQCSYPLYIGIGIANQMLWLFCYFFKQNLNRAYCWQIIAFFYMFDWYFLGWGWDAIKTDYSLLAWGHITYISNTCITSLALFICLTICFVVYK